MNAYVFTVALFVAQPPVTHQTLVSWSDLSKNQQSHIEDLFTYFVKNTHPRSFGQFVDFTQEVYPILIEKKNFILQSKVLRPKLLEFCDKTLTPPAKSTRRTARCVQIWSEALSVFLKSDVTQYAELKKHSAAKLFDTLLRPLLQKYTDLNLSQKKFSLYNPKNHTQIKQELDHLPFKELDQLRWAAVRALAQPIFTKMKHTKTQKDFDHEVTETLRMFKLNYER